MIETPDIVTEDLRKIDLDNLSQNQIVALQKAPTKEQFVEIMTPREDVP